MTTQNFHLAKICSMLGCSRTYLIDQINAGRLKATLRPWHANLSVKRYFVDRTELIRWMQAGGIPLELIRTALYPAGPVMLVRTKPELQEALAGTPTRLIQSLFQLGYEWQRRAAWAIVVDLPTVGYREACRSLGQFSRVLDRPEMIGLFEDEHPRNREAAAVFDVLLRRDAEPATIAGGILRLRKATHPG